MSATHSAGIDAGMRDWYRSCRCCLTDAHPEVVAALDAERRAQGEAPSGPGICEVAEGTSAPAQPGDSPDPGA
ncbi:MAG TPA: hypothetical protein VFM93_07890 [Candidatus Limnocylindria bacterium]|nr:hypothetical protein [Candidatus Limnocylindria bacterium]